MKYDLHIHSNISDGKLTRDEIISMAIDKKLEYIAFTEHNNFEEVQQQNNDLYFINGIEFDVNYNQKSFHILCYFKEYNDKIAGLIKDYQNNTNIRMKELLKKLKKIHGIELTLEELQQFSNKKYITKREVIDWLLENNYANSVDEAADNYTSKPASSYVSKYTLNFETVVDAIKSSGGKIILAHPNVLKYNKDEFDYFIKSLIDKGLDGIEIINTSKMDDNDYHYYRKIADKYNLLTSGGSDFHNPKIHNIGVDNNDAVSLIKVLKK